MSLSRICIFEGCEYPVKAKGLCAAHYTQKLKGQSLRPRLVMQQSSCSFEGCERPFSCKSYCEAHYEQWREGRNIATIRPKEGHGLTKTTEHSIWSGMKQRCHNSKDPAYRNYGGRGIKVCERWRNSFTAFLEDVGERPGQEYSIDRIDNNGDYEPGNVRWADRILQAFNRTAFRTSSGHRGVTWNKRRQTWQAQIGFRGEYRHLGSFTDIKDAVKARRKAEAEIAELLNG